MPSSRSRRGTLPEQGQEPPEPSQRASVLLDDVSEWLACRELGGQTSGGHPQVGAQNLQLQLTQSPSRRGPGPCWAGGGRRLRVGQDQIRGGVQGQEHGVPRRLVEV